MLYIAITFLLALVTISKLLRLNEEFGGGYFQGELFFFYIIFLAWYFIGKLYCIEWGKLTKGQTGVVLFVYERLVLPFVLIFFFLGKAPFESVINKPLYLVCVVLFFILLGDWFGIVKKNLFHWYPGASELEARKLFLTFPPASRLDMLPLDIYINGTYIFLIYKHVFSSGLF